MKRSLFYARKPDGSPFTFKHHGRSYRLFKRLDHEDAPYYFRFMSGGNSRQVGLATNQRDQAVVKAKLELDAEQHAKTLARYGHVLPANGAAARRTVATLGDIEDAYRALMAGVLVPGTVKDNILAVRLMVRQGQGQKITPGRCSMAAARQAADYVRAQPASVITGALVKAFERARLNELAGADLPERMSGLNTLNSHLTHARCVFAPDVVRQYKQRGLVLPDFEEFLTEKVAEPVAQPKQKPTRELLIKTFEAAPALAAQDPDAYMLWRLATYSLRLGDIMQAKRDWLKHGAWDDDEDFTRAPVARWWLEWPMSKGKRMNKVAIPDEDALMLVRYWEGEQAKRADWEKPFLVSSGVDRNKRAKKRLQTVAQRVYDWMRGLGWTSDKMLHEMRALYLRKAKAQFGNAEAAALAKTAELAGHRSTSTTSQHYTGETSLANRTVVAMPGLPKVPAMEANDL